jgi:2-phospho-L-lactate guanylyltransferase
MEPGLMWAVVPLKSPERAKSRLAGVLSPVQRRHLLFALAERVIGSLQATRGIDTVAVVTASAEVAAFARGLGAEPILQSAETGTASAFAAAVNQLQALQLPRLLMIAGDLPLVTPAALARVVAAAAGATPDVVVVPDRHRVGTNALLCAPPQALAPCFGADSFRRHLAAAKAAGIEARVLEIEELALDLDCAEDLQELRMRSRALAAALFGLEPSIDGGIPAHETLSCTALME